MALEYLFSGLTQWRTSPISRWTFDMSISDLRTMLVALWLERNMSNNYFKLCVWLHFLQTLFLFENERCAFPQFVKIL